MALSLLDGTSAAFDATTNTGTSVSWKATANYVSCDIGNELFEQTTFNSSGWRSRIRGMKQLVGRFAGFASKGASNSDPLYMFTGSGTTPTVITFDTGANNAACTLTFSMNPRARHVGMQAAGNSEDGLDFESSGTVTSAWITT